MTTITEINNGTDAYMWRVENPGTSPRYCDSHADALALVRGTTYRYQTVGCYPNTDEVRNLETSAPTGEGRT